MSRENVETVQRAVEAWNADDLDAFLAELAADVEWQPAIPSRRAAAVAPPLMMLTPSGAVASGDMDRSAKTRDCRAGTALAPLSES
jgi:hypothetical protein